MAHAKVEHRRDKVFPVPVGLCTRAFYFEFKHLITWIQTNVHIKYRSVVTDIAGEECRQVMFQIRTNDVWKHPDTIFYWFLTWRSIYNYNYNHNLIALIHQSYLKMGSELDTFSTFLKHKPGCIFCNITNLQVIKEEYIILIVNVKKNE